MKKNKFDFTEARYYYPYLKEVSDDYLAWFIGFFEAGGSLTITKKKEFNAVIVQRENNKHVLEKIAKLLQIGKVLVQKKHIVPGKLWVYKWIVHDIKSMNILLRLLQGNLVIPNRIHTLRNFIQEHNQKLLEIKEWRPTKYKDIEPIHIDKEKNIRVWPTSKDAWFSGYSDGDGCFMVSILKNSKAFRIRYVLAKKNDKNFCILSLWEYFASELLKTGTIHQEGVIEIRVKNMEKIYPYFDTFPLKTNKLNSYIFCKTMHNYFKEGYHLDDKKRETLLELIDNHRN